MTSTSGGGFRWSRRVGTIGALATILAAAAAKADVPSADNAAAQALFDEAKALMAASRFAEACPKFEESQRLDPTSGTLINLADCYERSGRIATAWSMFVDAATVSRRAGNPEREQVAKGRAAALAPKLSKLIISVRGADMAPGIEVKRDGRVVGAAQWGLPIPADPGSHAIVVNAPGRKTWQKTVAVAAAAQTVTVQVPELEPAEAQPGAAGAGPSTDQKPNGMSGQKVGALVAGGVGVVGVVVGSIFGLKSKAKRDDAAAVCTPLCADQSGLDLKADAMHAGNVATAAFIVGGVGLAAGAMLWLTDKREKSATPQVGLGPSGIIVKGAW
jgi:hypothetical protein